MTGVTAGVKKSLRITGPKWSEGVPLTEESVRAALADPARELWCADDPGKPTSVLVFPDVGSVTVTYHAEGFWDEDALVCEASHNAYAAARTLFANPLVQEVDVKTTAELTDAYGKSSTQQVLGSWIDRATVAEKVDWDGLGDRLEDNDELWFCIAHGTVAPVAEAGFHEDSCWWDTPFGGL